MRRFFPPRCSRWEGKRRSVILNGRLITGWPPVGLNPAMALPGFNCETRFRLAPHSTGGFPMPITRRTFLETAGAALTTRAMLPARDELPVQVAVIGTGARGSDLIRALTTIEGVELVGVCDDYPPHLEQGAKYAGPKAKTFADYRKLLDELKPQAVVVAVPLHLHYRIAADCIAAGRHLFLEKT